MEILMIHLKLTPPVSKIENKVSKIENKVSKIENIVKKASKIENKVSKIENKVSKIENKSKWSKIENIVKKASKIKNKASKIENKASKIESKVSKIENIVKKASKIENKVSKIENKASKIENKASKIENIVKKASKIENKVSKIENKARTKIEAQVRKMQLINSALKKETTTVKTAENNQEGSILHQSQVTAFIYCQYETKLIARLKLALFRDHPILNRACPKNNERTQITPSQYTFIRQLTCDVVESRYSIIPPTVRFLSKILHAKCNMVFLFPLLSFKVGGIRRYYYINMLLTLR
uniref:Uncharacterized protein n=1 Tax=Glossina austeni TaxID=7395 RepID=A0A1A9UWW2_GLOAU